MTTTHINGFLPISSAVQLHLTHNYAHHFHEVANAFLLKYNFENRFCYTTIASSQQLDEDRFEIVRRMENSLSSTPVFERIIFNRQEQSVRGYTFETDESKSFTEHYVYRREQDGSTEKTLYDMFLYKNPGLKKMLRYKLHAWGVQTTEGIIKGQRELREKTEQAIKEAREKLVERKDKLVQETIQKKDSIKEKIIGKKVSDEKK